VPVELSAEGKNSQPYGAQIMSTKETNRTAPGLRRMFTPAIAME